MGSPITTYVTLVTTSGVLTLIIGLYAFFQRHNIPAARLFITYIAVQIVYIFAKAFEMSSRTLEAVMGWTVVEYVGIAYAPILGLLFILRYIGRTVSLRTMGLTLIIPTITWIMVATNEWHHLFYRSIQIREGYELPLIDVEIGQWYVVHGAYTFGCMLVGAILLYRQWGGTNGMYRKQLFALLCGQVIPMLAAFVYLLGLTPGGVDPVPFIMCFTAAMYVWAMLTTRFLTLVPIAKEVLFESMREGVMVLDANCRLIEYNQAVKTMLPSLDAGMIGMRADELWQQIVGESSRDFAVEERAFEVALGSGNEERSYHVRLTPIHSSAGHRIGWLLMLIDMTEHKQLQRQLETMAYYDGLTNLYNRAEFMRLASACLSRLEQEGGSLSFILFDIDHFKQVNDTYGHAAGDRIIRFVADLGRASLTTEMILARYGGEEFAVALPGYSREQAQAWAAKYLQKMKDTPYEDEEMRYVVSASFGVAEATPDDTLEAWLQQADVALYEAKRSGRGRVCVAEPTNHSL